MKCLILAAGYATRLYPLTRDKAKPLLPIAGKAVIEHIISRIEQIAEIDEILVVTNDKFFGQFQQWQRGFSAKQPVKILNDHSSTEKDRLGAIGDMDFVVEQERIADDLLVVAGDNLFELPLDNFLEFAAQKIPAFSIGLYHFKNKEEVTKYSEVHIDADNRITSFIEKPAHPTSTLIAKCLYFFPAEKLGLISEYIRTGGSIDAPGHYISWLCQRDKVYGYVFQGKWYDIGSYEVYKRADKEFASLG